MGRSVGATLPRRILKCYFTQSGSPTASAGRFCAVAVELGEVVLLDELDEVPVFGLVLPVLGIPVRVVSLRTCLVAVSQHFCVVLEAAALGLEVDDEEV